MINWDSKSQLDLSIMIQSIKTSDLAVEPSRFSISLTVFTLNFYKLLLSIIGGTINSQVVVVVKNLPLSARDLRDAGSIPGWGRSPREGNGNPLQYPCLENLMDRGSLRSMGSQRIGHDWTHMNTSLRWEWGQELSPGQVRALWARWKEK